MYLLWGFLFFFTARAHTHAHTHTNTQSQSHDDKHEYNTGCIVVPVVCSMVCGILAVDSCKAVSHFCIIKVNGRLPLKGQGFLRVYV